MTKPKHGDMGLAALCQELVECEDESDFCGFCDKDIGARAECWPVTSDRLQSVMVAIRIRIKQEKD